MNFYRSDILIYDPKFKRWNIKIKKYIAQIDITYPLNINTKIDMKLYTGKRPNIFCRAVNS